MNYDERLDRLEKMNQQAVSIRKTLLDIEQGQTGALKRHEQWMHDFETKMLEIEDKLNALIDIKRNGMEGTKGGTSV
jgi:hypothetical protein